MIAQFKALIICFLILVGNAHVITCVALKSSLKFDLTLPITFFALYMMSNRPNALTETPHFPEMLKVFIYFAFRFLYSGIMQ